MGCFGSKAKKQRQPTTPLDSKCNVQTSPNCSKLTNESSIITPQKTKSIVISSSPSESDQLRPKIISKLLEASNKLEAINSNVGSVISGQVLHSDISSSVHSGLSNSKISHVSNIATELSKLSSNASNNSQIASSLSQGCVSMSHASVSSKPSCAADNKKGSSISHTKTEVRSGVKNSQSKFNGNPSMTLVKTSVNSKHKHSKLKQ